MTNALAAEWVKLRSVRSTVYTALLAVALASVLGMLLSNGLARAYVAGTAEERAAFDPTHVSLMACFYFAQLAVGALGVLNVTAEYATGLIRTSLAAVPRRGTVLAAKAVVLGGAAFVLGQVTAFAAYLGGQAVLAAGGAPHTSLGDPHVLRAVLGAGVWLTAVALVGVALGALLRATAGAFAILVACTLIVPLVSDFLPEWVGRWWPTIAGLGITHVVPEAGALGPWQGLAVLFTGVAGLLAAAFVVLRGRDV